MYLHSFNKNTKSNRMNMFGVAYGIKTNYFNTY